MHTRSGILAAAAISVIALAGCTSYEEGESSGSATPSDSMSETAMAQECTPVAGDTIVVLEDDLQLQLSDNVVPAVNADSATEPVLSALAVVSDSLDTPTLIQLNKSVDIDRQTSGDVAAQFVADNGLTAPSTGEGSLVIGTANFSEAITVGEIYAEVLRTAGYTVEVRTIGTRETYMPALQSGEVDIVPEYAATATEYLNKSINGAEAATVASGDVEETLAAAEPLAEQAGIVFGEPSAAQTAATAKQSAQRSSLSETGKGSDSAGSKTFRGEPAEFSHSAFGSQPSRSGSRHSSMSRQSQPSP